MRIKELADRVMGSAPVRAGALATTRGRLRVLGAHGVERPDVLDAQLAWVRRHLQPVGLAEVLDAIDGTRALPPRAVWVTFDDGDPSVVEAGLPVLARHRIRPTMFVCPGVLDTDRPLWWQALDDEREIARLKRLPDAERRAAVAASGNAERPRRQLTTDALRAFAEHGDVGNHTWDHPMLDACDEEEQRRQVHDAHVWLSDALGSPPVAFAYPNGTTAPGARAELVALGYRVAVLHDHRIATLNEPLGVSRLRAGDHLSPARFAAVAAGVHPLVHALRTR